MYHCLSLGPTLLTHHLGNPCEDSFKWPWAKAQPTRTSTFDLAMIFAPTSTIAMHLSHFFNLPKGGCVRMEGVAPLYMAFKHLHLPLVIQIIAPSMPLVYLGYILIATPNRISIPLSNQEHMKENRQFFEL